MSISIGTIARTACLALALTNQLLSAAGRPVLPIEDSQLEALITSGLTVAASLAAWWKNNSFTPAAIRAVAALNAAPRPCPPANPHPHGGKWAEHLTKGRGDSTLKTRNFITFI